jgi:transposase
MGKVPAEERGWSLTLGRKDLSGLPHHQKPAPNGFAEGWSIYPPSPIGVPPVQQEDAVAFLQQGWSIREVAQHLGAPRGSIHRLARKEGVQLQDNGPKLTPAQQEEAMGMLRSGASLRKVAERFGIDHESVRRMIKRKRRLVLSRCPAPCFGRNRRASDDLQDAQRDRQKYATNPRFRAYSCILVLRSFPRGTTVNELVSAVLKAVTQLAHLDISNCLYMLDPGGLEEEL